MPKRDGSPTRGEAKDLARMSKPSVSSRLSARPALEKHYKAYIRKWWVFWINMLEPTLGSSLGIPDCLLMIDLSLQPVELKVGTIEDNRVFPREVRGAQIAWHRGFEKVGGSSFILIGVRHYIKGKEHWASFAVSGERARDWHKGYAIGTEAIMISDDTDSHLTARLIAFTRDYRKGHFRP